MSELDGSYDVVATTPLGEQKATMTFQVDGATFTGTTSGSMGTSDLAGAVNGDKLTWKQVITVPLPLTLECVAMIKGGELDGIVNTGAFGSFPLKGKKVG